VPLKAVPEGFSICGDFGGPAGTCRKPSRVACQQSPHCMPHACQSTERLFAHRRVLETPLVHSAGCAARPRKRSRAESTLAMNCSVFAVASFTALPPLARDCSRLRGVYGWSKIGFSARARARAEPLDKVLRKGGNSAFGVLCAQRESQGPSRKGAHAVRRACTSTHEKPIETGFGSQVANSLCRTRALRRARRGSKSAVLKIAHARACVRHDTVCYLFVFVQEGI
jgi:hypothetical protein